MTDKYLSVSNLNKYIKHKIDSDIHLQEVYLKGEVSNFRPPTRGHLYFTIKDDNSKISAVMFASYASKMKFNLEDGMKVLVKGKVGVYEAAGNYQIYVTDIEEDGIGNLYLAYEKLKQQLETEGLFSDKHKKTIPKYPNKIGIITAATGAAIKDILTTIKRRYPICQTILFPSLVQGQGSVEDLIKNLLIADDYNLDIIIIGRGGGSIEDLWSFNNEQLARTIFAAKTPIISAVGHEIDFTISDFVSDLRAPTPTAAAELAVPDLKYLKHHLSELETRLIKVVNNKLKHDTNIYNKIISSFIFKSPLTIYQAKEQKLDYLLEKLNYSFKEIVSKITVKFSRIMNSYIFTKPELLLKAKENILLTNIEKLNVLNPLQTLQRGYSITRYNNKVITDIKHLKLKDTVEIELNKSYLQATVIKKEEK